MNKKSKKVEDLLLRLEKENVTISESVSNLLIEEDGELVFPLDEISNIIVGNGGDPLTTFYKYQNGIWYCDTEYFSDSIGVDENLLNQYDCWNYVTKNFSKCNYGNQIYEDICNSNILISELKYISFIELLNRLKTENNFIKLVINKDDLLIMKEV
jgi:hypothetical protein